MNVYVCVCVCRMDPTFDELLLFRGPIKNVKQKESESVGILKMKAPSAPLRRFMWIGFERADEGRL